MGTGSGGVVRTSERLVGGHVRRQLEAPRPEASPPDRCAGAATSRPGRTGRPPGRGGRRRSRTRSPPCGPRTRPGPSGPTPPSTSRSSGCRRRPAPPAPRRRSGRRGSPSWLAVRRGGAGERRHRAAEGGRPASARQHSGPGREPGSVRAQPFDRVRRAGRCRARPAGSRSRPNGRSPGGDRGRSRRSPAGRVRPPRSTGVRPAGAPGRRGARSAPPRTARRGAPAPPPPPRAAADGRRRRA